MFKAADGFTRTRKTILSALNRTALEAEHRGTRISEYRPTGGEHVFSHGSSVIATILLVGAAVAATAQPVGNGTVIVSDTALTPAVETVPVGTVVVWTNRGARAHSIASNKGVLPVFAFSLASASSQRVPFTQTGRYPYTEDGSIQGTIIVVTAAGQEATDAAGADDCHHPTVYHYDVLVTQSLSIDGQLREGNGSFMPGKFSLKLDSKAHWSNLPLEVKRCKEHTNILINSNTSGEFNETETWNDTTHYENDGARPCQFTTAFSSQALVSLGGNYTYRTGIANFSFHTKDYTNATNSLGHDAVWAQHNYCPVGTGTPVSHANTDVRLRISSDPHPWFAPSLDAVGGFDYAVEGTTMTLRSNHKTVTEIPFPLDVLSAGRDFKFDSGQHNGTYDRRESTGNLSTHLTVTFTGVPGG